MSFPIVSTVKVKEIYNKVLASKNWSRIIMFILVVVIIFLILKSKSTVSYVYYGSQPLPFSSTNTVNEISVSNKLDLLVALIGVFLATLGVISTIFFLLIGFVVFRSGEQQDRLDRYMDRVHTAAERAEEEARKITTNSKLIQKLSARSFDIQRKD